METVLLLGSIARGDATMASDIDLAVIAPVGWVGRTELEDAVQTRLGSGCDVLVFTREEFSGESPDREPVVREIVTDGVALIGSMPRVKNRVA